MPYKQDILILAKTIYGEARGEYKRSDGGLPAFIAIANVIMNRLKEPEKYGYTIIEVCQKPWQFSCWNKKDPNFALLQSGAITDALFPLCLDVAEKVSSHLWPDLVKNSNHYHAVSMRPFWIQAQTPVAKIGQHLFYKL